jgi:hypothetical protein
MLMMTTTTTKTRNKATIYVHLHVDGIAYYAKGVFGWHDLYEYYYKMEMKTERDKKKKQE